jgi:dolichol-phosphate mannosyltransferase
MKLCVVVPVYNEQAVLPEFLRRVGVSLQRLEMGPHQLLFVDDGSTDATLEILREAAAHDPRVAVLSLSRNFGHQAAITAALDHVRADATVIMDADLQDPPEKIAEFIQKWKEGYDVVYARRIKRKESWWFRLSYFVFYRLLSALSNVELPIDVGDFGLMSARVVEEVRKMPEHLRFTRGLRAWVGFRQAAIPIERSERQAGDSKYTPLRLFRLAADGIFAFSSAPLHAASVLGLIAVCLSSAFAIYSILAKWLFHQSPKGFTALTVLITFVSGVNLMFLGVIGAYVGRIYEEVKARPVYIIDKKLGALFER